MILRFLLAALAVYAAPAFAADHLTPAQTMRLAAVRVYNPASPEQIGGGAHAFGPQSSVVSAVYSAPGVGFYNNMFFRKTPLVSDAGATQATTALSGSAIAITTTTAIPVTAPDCTGIAPGQQLIDSSAGAMVGVVSSCTLSPTTVNLTANNLVAISAGDSLVAQNTYPDACQGTFTQRIRGNGSSVSNTVFPTLQAANGFINANGQGDGVYEASNGLWFEWDPHARFNWHNPANLAAGPSLNDNVIIPVDTWLNIIVSWNSCAGGGGYAVIYYAPQGGSWTRGGFVGDTSGFSSGSITLTANTSSPLQGLNNNAFSFGADALNLGYYFEGDTEDDMLDMGMTQGSVGLSGTSNPALCAAPNNDGNPCIPDAVLAKFYNQSSGKPVRVNSTGNCSDLFGHQPTVCFSTDSGGTYNPSYANFGTNYGYGGAFGPSTLAKTGATPGPAVVPVAGPPSSNYVFEKWITYNNATGAGENTLQPLNSNLGQHTFASGDFIVVAGMQYFGTGSGQTITCNTGNGWNQLWSGSVTGPTNLTAVVGAVCYKVAVGSTDTTTAFTVSDTTKTLYYQLMDYQGVDVSSSGANAVDAYSIAYNIPATTTITMPAIVTSYANDLYVGISMVSAANGYITAPSGMGLRGYTGNYSAVFDKVIASPGVFSPGNVINGSAGQYIGVSLALKPAGASFAPASHIASLTYQGNASGKFQIPATASVTAKCWGGGAAGNYNNQTWKGGGSGGGFAEGDGLSPTGHVVYFQAGAGGLTSTSGGVGYYGGQSSWINIAGANAAPGAASNGCLATGGTINTATAGGAVGTGVYGATYATSGGAGGAAGGTSNYEGGGGGGGGGAGGNGGVGATGANGVLPTPGGAGGAAGASNSPGGAGGVGGQSTPYPPTSGSVPGGGGGGSGYLNSAGSGGAGEVSLGY